MTAEMTEITEVNTDWTLCADAAKRWADVVAGDWHLVGRKYATNVAMDELVEEMGWWHCSCDGCRRTVVARLPPPTRLGET